MLILLHSSQASRKDVSEILSRLSGMTIIFQQLAAATAVFVYWHWTLCRVDVTLKSENVTGSNF